jgi:hypothetical protein
MPILEVRLPTTSLAFELIPVDINSSTQKFSSSSTPPWRMEQVTHLVNLLTNTIASDYRLTLAKLKLLTSHGEISQSSVRNTRS